MVVCVDSNCMNCSDENTCVRCQDGYEVDENGVCIKSVVVCADANCANCSDANTCVHCKEGFKLEDGAVCKEGET